MLQVYKGCIEDDVESNVHSLRASLLLSTRTAMRAPGLVAAAAILLACGRNAMAGSKPTAGRTVAPVIANILAAWNRADAHAIAAQYETGGDFVSPDGIYATGRREIETFYRGAFAQGYAGSRATAVVSHLRDLTGTVALIDGAWTIEPTPASKIRQPEAGLFFAVLHRHNGRWWIAALREQSSARTLREFGAVNGNPHDGRP
ncbi:MAG TPA: SgcJ/EcaC family oxidoreductase [Steroidobacteraceae bacterium]|nr:SgcJ/EcaC family oxidoreductase [Steroidobacteraceae bacterium]